MNDDDPDLTLVVASGVVDDSELNMLNVSDHRQDGTASVIVMQNEPDHETVADANISVDMLGGGDSAEIDLSLSDVSINNDIVDYCEGKRTNQRRASQRMKAMLEQINEMEELLELDRLDDETEAQNRQPKRKLDDDLPNAPNVVNPGDKEETPLKKQRRTEIIMMESQNTFQQNELIMSENTDSTMGTVLHVTSPKRKPRGRPRKKQTVADALFENLSLPHKCSKCSKAYGSEEVLASHAEVHKEHFPIVCSVCQKSFNSKGGFDNHIRGHDSMNQIQCPYCEFRCPNYTVMKPACIIEA